MTKNLKDYFLSPCEFSRKTTQSSKMKEDLDLVPGPNLQNQFHVYVPSSLSSSSSPSFCEPTNEFVDTCGGGSCQAENRGPP